MRSVFYLVHTIIVTAVSISQLGYTKCETAQSNKIDRQSISLAEGIAIETVPVTITNVAGVATNIFLAKHEVTEALWYEIMGGDAPNADELSLPKVGIDFNEINKFLRKLNDRPEVVEANLAFRLPTATELAIPISMATIKSLDNGNDGYDTDAPEPLLAGGWFAENADDKRHPVGSAMADVNGVFDLLGNVWEMTLTEVPGDKNFIICVGGSFKQKVSRCKSGFEYWYGKHDNEKDVGFRLVIVDREEYMAWRNSEDREMALTAINVHLSIVEINQLLLPKSLGVLSRINNNMERAALKKLKKELTVAVSEEGTSDAKNSSMATAKNGDRLVVWKSELNGTEITFDGKSFAFRSTNRHYSYNSFGGYGKTECILTMGDTQQTKIFFKKIGEAWDEMIKGPSLLMKTSLPEADRAEWTYKDSTIEKAYGRKRFAKLTVRSEGDEDDLNEAKWLILSSAPFQAKESDFSCMTEIRISEEDVFAIRMKFLSVEDLVSKYERMTGVVAEATKGSDSTEVKVNGDISALVAKLNKDMVDVPNRSFRISKYEVTQSLWTALMGNNPSYFKGDNLPVDTVSWEDCQKFLTKLNSLPEVRNAHIVYRLPSDEEWKFVCKTGYVDDEKNLCEYAWTIDTCDSNPSTHSIGTKKPNALGVYDMIGNVAEWTSNESIGKYFRNCQGASFADQYVKVDGNERILPYCYKGPDVGFRLVCDFVK